MKEFGESGVLANKSLEFAVSAVNYSRLLKERKEFALANQFLRAATSVSANIHEAAEVESRRDFIHKLKIASKEASEATFWLKLFAACEGFPDTNNLPQMLHEIRRILGKSISTATNNLKQKAAQKNANNA
jgi:four helix bundle protein